MLEERVLYAIDACVPASVVVGHQDEQGRTPRAGGAAGPQPVVARQTLMNVPEQGFYNWDPGAFFGMYRPDTFWFR
jgi:hypothetical protein